VAFATIALETGYAAPVLRLHYMPGRASMAPHAALAEAEADYALVLVEEDEHGDRPSAYRLLNPWGQVPTLEDGSLVLFESVAIMLHLADRYPDTGLGAPVGSGDRAALYRWLAYLSSAVQPTHMHWYYPERYTADPRGTSAVRACASATLHRHIEWIDGELATRPWLVGKERTGADLFLFMLTQWGRFQEPAAPEPPNLRNHFERLLERPGVRRMMSEEELG
jgi:glutathione S-transferase